MANDTKTFGNADQFVSRFNRIMLGNVLRAESMVVTDTEVTKFVLITTRNLSDLIALNLEFRLLDDSSTGSPADTGFATNSYDGGDPNSQLQFTARQPGLQGNGISITFVDVGNTFSGLPPVAVNGKAITVSINEGTTTAAEVLQALDNNSSARLLVTFVNGAGSSGAAAIQAGVCNLVSGGSNLPHELINPALGSPSIGTQNLSTTFAQRLDSSGSTKLHFSATSPGEYANIANLIFGKDAFGLETLEYREGNQAGEKAVELRIQPAGSAGSFIDAVANFTNLAPLTAADITLLTATGSLTLALGGIDVISDPDQKTFLTWNAYEFYDAVEAAFTGGRSGIPDDYNDIVGAVIGNSADKTGLYAYANRTVFDNSLIAAPGFDQSAVVAAGLAIAEAAGDMVYVVDPPAGTDVEKGLTPQDVVDWHNGQGFGNTAAFNSSYGGLYYGWMKTQDIFNNVSHWVPPSVLVLEQIAFSDNAAEVWFAPAGFKRGRLLKALAVQENATNDQGDRDFMYSGGNAVNPLVNFPKDGVVIFGQRTLQRSASALDRLNVRRMMNYIKRTSTEAAKIELFEPNDKVLWAQLTKILTPIYQDVKNKRGINRFEVVFNDQTTTPLARDNNEVYGFIIVEPTKAAEKIILSFVITAQGASFSEALAAAGVA
jgi:hypothetical protein